MQTGLIRRSEHWLLLVAYARTQPEKKGSQDMYDANYGIRQYDKLSCVSKIYWLVLRSSSKEAWSRPIAGGFCALRQEETTGLSDPGNNMLRQEQAPGVLPVDVFYVSARQDHTNKQVRLHRWAVKAREFYAARWPTSRKTEATCGPWPASLLVLGMYWYAFTMIEERILQTSLKRKAHIAG